jgi:hypothetical protein
MSADTTQEPDHLPPDGAKAFELVDKMENDLFGIARLLDALFIIAESMDDDIIEESRVANALFAIRDALREHHKRADAARAEIFHLTWGYKYPTEATEIR